MAFEKLITGNRSVIGTRVASDCALADWSFERLDAIYLNCVFRKASGSELCV